MNSNTQNGSDRTIHTNIVKKISITESDSVHPRFGDKPSEREVQEFHRKYDFYCRECKDYFAPTLLALREHFKPGRIKHTHTRSCIYCKGPVYDYFINEKEKIYHDCLEKEAT